MPLNTRQIEIFRAIMITGSVSGASRLLHVSQPAVSRALAYTEQRLGFTLFERNKSRLLATLEGKELFREIEQVYRGIQRVNDRARELGERRSGVLHLVSSASLGHELIPTAIARFRHENDQIKITFCGLSLSPLLESLITQRAELGLTIVPFEHPNMAIEPLCEGEVVCVFPLGHPLSKLEKLTAGDLYRYPLVAYPHETPFGTIVESIFDGAGKIMRVAIEVASPQEACSVVAAGGGIALIDTFSFKSRVGRGLDARPLDNSPKLMANLVYSRLEPLSRLARDFCNTLANVAQEQGFRLVEPGSSGPGSRPSHGD
jgi:DNA-binding transcriptional LysR family regulator